MSLHVIRFHSSSTGSSLLSSPAALSLQSAPARPPTLRRGFSLAPGLFLMQPHVPMMLFFHRCRGERVRVSGERRAACACRNLGGAKRELRSMRIASSGRPHPPVRLLRRRAWLPHCVPQPQCQQTGQPIVERQAVAAKRRQATASGGTGGAMVLVIRTDDTGDSDQRAGYAVARPRGCRRRIGCSFVNTARFAASATAHPLRAPLLPLSCAPPPFGWDSCFREYAHAAALAAIIIINCTAPPSCENTD